MWKFYSWFRKFRLSFTFEWVGRWRKWRKNLENDSSVEIRDVNTRSLDDKLNVKDKEEVEMLNNRLQSNFVSKNVVNLSRLNFTNFEISLLSKRLSFVWGSNKIDKAKIKTELEALGRILR